MLLLPLFFEWFLGGFEVVSLVIDFQGSECENPTPFLKCKSGIKPAPSFCYYVELFHYTKTSKP